MILPGAFACLFLFCQNPQQHAGDSLIGSSGCRAELKREDAGFMLALDRKQNVFAEVRTIQSKPTMLVLQYSSEKDKCGAVKDLVVAPDSRDIFEFECVDRPNPKRAVIGIHPDGPFAKSWTASRAWIVDFEKLKLIPTKDPVTCVNYNYAGTDDGSDVRTRTAARVKQH